MAARNRPGLSENTRKRIQTTMITKRLQDHIVGKVEMTNTQVQAALGLLKKTLPDLQSQEIKQEITEKKTVKSEPMGLSDWEKRANTASGGPQGPYPEPTADATEH